MPLRPAPLGGIKGAIGGCDEAAGGSHAFGEGGHSKTHGNVSARAGHGGDLRAQSLGGPQGAVTGRIGQYGDELLAAVARDQFAFAGHDLEQPAELAQHIVAVLVAVRVVDLLEMVDIEEHQRERLLVAPGPFVLDFELFVKGAMVAQAGQPVGRRQFGQKLIGMFELGFLRFKLRTVLVDALHLLAQLGLGFAALGDIGKRGDSGVRRGFTLSRDGRAVE